MKRVALLGVLCGLGACGGPVDAVVVVPGSALGKLGDRLEGQSARFYEGDKLFALVNGERVDVSAIALRHPLVGEPFYVVGPWAAVHDDVDAKDRGQVALPFGSKVELRAGLGAGAGLLLIKGGWPAGFVRPADVRSSAPVARDLVAAGKAALLAKNLDEARTFAVAALEADAKLPEARRLAGAMRNRAGDVRGWPLWISARPPDAPVDLPLVAAAVVGQAWVTGSGVSLRGAASTTAKRLGFLETGALVNVRAIEGPSGGPEWAAVDIASVTPHRLALSWSALVDGSDPWGAAPPEQASSSSLGFVALKLLSSVAPDALALRALGLQRVATRHFDVAVVPLSRALALRPDDDEARSALFQAAVETERYVLALQTLDRPARAPGVSFELLRVRGCVGDVDKARSRLEEPGAMLQPPAWDFGTNSGSAGSFALPAGESLCFLDAEEEQACHHGQGVDDEQSFLGARCADEITPTPAQHAAFLAYEKEQTQIVADTKVQWAAYTKAFAAFTARRTEALGPTAVVVRMSNVVDQPAGTLAVYGFGWTLDGWCEDVTTADRSELTVKTLRVPAMKANETYELWIEGVDLSQAWGAVLLDGANDRAAFESALKVQTRDDNQFRHPPDAWSQRAAEAGKGVGPCNMFPCCGC
ncbi:MAG: hypothetical protein Q8O67_18665 [Deltaproteobacteria bacterium]|nr:hypothetical protein [Deltaproteobacteria bacterium]